MAQLGVQPQIADRIVNHQSGVISGVAAVYNKFEYREERKAALDAWGQYLDLLVHPDKAQANVVALHAR